MTPTIETATAVAMEEDFDSELFRQPPRA